MWKVPTSLAEENDKVGFPTATRPPKHGVRGDRGRQHQEPPDQPQRVFTGPVPGRNPPEIDALTSSGHSSSTRHPPGDPRRREHDGERSGVRVLRSSTAYAPPFSSQKERPYTWTFRHGRPRLLLQAPGITPTMEVVWTAAYVLQDNKSGLQAIVIAHVDDLLWSGTQAMDKVMDEIIKEFKFGAIEFGDKFDYCGRTVEQGRDGTTVTCPNNAAKVRAIYLEPERRERNQIRSVVGSLNWLVRVCRIDIAYEVHRLQAVMQKALVEDLMPHKGMHFKYEAFDIHHMTIYSITDASVGADYDISKKGEPMADGKWLPVRETAAARAQQSGARRARNAPRLRVPQLCHSTSMPLYATS